MCIALPCKVIEVSGDTALVELGGTRRSVLLDLVDDVRVGEYVIVHAGYAINKVDQKVAEETLDLVRNMNLDELMS
jgi:hydrogenase expression/formation protein HypC